MDAYDVAIREKTRRAMEEAARQEALMVYKSSYRDLYNNYLEELRRVLKKFKACGIEIIETLACSERDTAKFKLTMGTRVVIVELHWPSDGYLLQHKCKLPDIEVRWYLSNGTPKGARASFFAAANTLGQGIVQDGFDRRFGEWIVDYL